MIKKKYYPKDLIDIFLLLKKTDLKNFDESIPSMMLELIFEFIWNVIYKAKIISKHRKRRNISLIDLEIACEIILINLKKIESNLNNLDFGNNIISSIKLPKKKKENFFDLPGENFLLIENNISHTAKNYTE
jgi:hypothetical protein